MADTTADETRTQINDRMVLAGYRVFSAHEWRVIEGEIDLRRIMPHQARHAMDVLCAEVSKRPKPIQVVGVLKRRPWETPEPHKSDYQPTGDLYRELRERWEYLPPAVQKDLLDHAGNEVRILEYLQRQGVEFAAAHDDVAIRCYCADCEVRRVRGGMRLYPQIRVQMACWLMRDLEAQGTLQGLVDAARQEKAQQAAPLLAGVGQNETGGDVAEDTPEDIEADVIDVSDTSDTLPWI